MNLKNNQITLGELWDNPAARAVFQRKIPLIAGHPVRGAARTVTLEQLMDFMSSWVPSAYISAVIKDLNKL